MSATTTRRQRAPSTRHTADERRGQVIAAAIAEFAQQGYQAASTAAIARRAGISQPYIYALFPSKQDLFIAVHDEVVGRILGAFTEAAARGRTPEDRLSMMGDVYHDLIADGDALRAQLQTYATGDPVIRAHAARAYRGLYDAVTRLSGAGAAEVSLFFACGMFANVTVALGIEDLCAPLFDTAATALRAAPA
jgi:AcrR family transcriptional regulator